MKGILFVFFLTLLGSTTAFAEIPVNVCLELQKSHNHSIELLNEAIFEGQLSEEEIGETVDALNGAALIFNDACPKDIQFILIS